MRDLRIGWERTMPVHDLQLPRGEFEALLQGELKHTIVHGLMVVAGDTLRVRENELSTNIRTGRELTVMAVDVMSEQMLCILSNKSLPKGAVILSIQKLSM